MSRPNRNQQSFPERPEQTGGRNLFDRSYPFVASFRMGKLIPFFYDWTLPNDTFHIANSSFFRFAPQYLPIMTRVNVSFSYFYIPWRLVWTGRKQDSWEWFIRDEASVEAPYFIMNTNWLLDGSGARPTTILEYLGIPSVQTSFDVNIQNVKLNCLILSAILLTWDEYYRNDQIQGARWFELTGGDNSTGIEAAFPQETIGLITIKLLPLLRNWNRDAYTSATPSPQVGANVLVPIMRNNSVDQGTWSYLGPTVWKQFSDHEPSPAGFLRINNLNHTHNDTTDEQVYLDIQETSASIRDFRFAAQLTEYLERLMRVGDRYRDFIKGFWNVDPFPLLVDRPAYLGGSTGQVVISEVLSHAETVDSDNEIVSAVGSYSGQMLSMDNQPTLRYHCLEHGCVIGLMSVYPKTSYFQGLDKMWRATNKYDYPWEQFALIGDEAIQHNEVMLSYLESDNMGVDDGDLHGWNIGIFGYLPRYWNWRYRNGVIAGQMRDSESPLFSFHMARFFDVNDSSGLNLNSEFLECKPDVTRVFQVTEHEEEIYCYIWNDVQVIRQLPKFGIPAL